MSAPSSTAVTSVQALTLRQPRTVSARATWIVVVTVRTVLVAGFFAAWQWLPTIEALRTRITFMDPFFISSPQLVAERMWNLIQGSNGYDSIWPNLQFTVVNTLIGTVIAVVIGTLLGLLLANNPLYERILRPIIVVLNAIPRVAVVPIMILVAGSAAKASILTAITVVVFLVFFNALEAGRGTPKEMIDAARVAGAGPRDVMVRVRLPYVLGWVAAALPNAIAFGLVGTVTTEIFVGASGMGQLLTTAVNTADATLTFSVVVFLGFTGAVLVLGVGRLQQALMPWWSGGSAR
ncbi:ABC transporter permease [Nocardioides marmotae]|uniref:ABC transporter permease n=1 Tax=Nocardioides marmotae TaxID=2663857 RepID=UPI0012B55144|nr:ABC transporter permease subunit [Nocardioides marmotae]MBC9734763.1 ABC transporter permease subunit [Nocardioides marmotae]MTB85864.1 ABC transporter permease subunit [Nocardioides marmotae]